MAEEREATPEGAGGASVDARDLDDAMEQSLASREILLALGRQGDSSDQILDTIVERARRLCRADAAQLALLDGDVFRLSRLSGDVSEEYERYMRGHPVERSRASISGRVAEDRRTQQITDVLGDQEYGRQDLQRLAGYRTLLAAPMVLEDEVVGVLTMWRRAVAPFSERDTRLLDDFAAQAAVALRQVELMRSLETRSNELASKVEQLEALRELGEAVGSSLDPDEVLSRIVTNAVRLTGTDGGSIMEYDEDTDSFLVRTAYGTSEALVAELRATTIRRDSTLVGRAATQRRPLEIADLSTADLDPHLDALHRDGWQSVLAIPMVRGDLIVGVLVIRRRSVGAFPEEMVDLLETFASQSSVAIVNARLFRELAQKVELLEAVRGVGEAISASLDLNEVLERILASAVRLSSADGGLMIEYDETERTFDTRLVLGASASLLDRLDEQMGVADGETMFGRFGQAAMEGRVLEIPDTTVGRLDPMAELLIADGWRSLLSVPIRREQRLVGVLLVRRAHPGTFPPSTTDLLLTLAAQSAIAIINARLFREVEAKSAELEVASRHKSEFLASMSHELRTPLNAVIGFSEVLADRLFGELNERQDEYVRDIWNSGRHLLELLNEILDLSKVEAGQMALEPTTFRVADALEYALSLVRERAAAHQIALDLTLDEDVGSVHADELRFKQVVLNLVSNAVKFTPDGGRGGRARGARRRRARRHRDRHRRRHPARGPGAHLRVLPAGRPRGRPRGGHRARAHAVAPHRGALRGPAVAGVGGRGGQHLRLRHPRATPTRVARGRPRTGRARTRLILLVDDDRASLDLLTAYLDGSGSRLERAGDGEEALRLARALRPDVVVLDIRLPRVDGWEVLAELREGTRPRPGSRSSSPPWSTNARKVWPWVPRSTCSSRSAATTSSMPSAGSGRCPPAGRTSWRRDRHDRAASSSSRTTR